MMRWVLVMLASLLVASPAIAQSSLEALEQRGEILGWEAVGRLDAPGSFCTGTLIADDLVLTAAHCVIDGAGHQRAPETLTFRAGYANGTSIAERKAIRVVVADGYRHAKQGQQTAENVMTDVALVRLERAISSSEAAPFRIHENPQQGDSVSVVSYGRGRSEALSRQANCNVTERFSGGLMSFDCDVTFGSSGAPVFVRYGTRVRILSLISGGVDLEGDNTVSYGMELPQLVTQLRAEMRKGFTQPQVSTGARRITVGDRSATGARFVRP